MGQQVSERKNDVAATLRDSGRYLIPTQLRSVTARKAANEDEFYLSVPLVIPRKRRIASR